MEQTFVMIKPDAVLRGLVGTVLSRFENRGMSCHCMTPFKLLVG